MHLTNSTGQTVSLLNDGGAAAASLRKHAHAKSRSIDCRQLTLPSLASLSASVSEDACQQQQQQQQQQPRRSTLGGVHHSSPSSNNPPHSAQSGLHSSPNYQRGTHQLRYYSYGTSSSSSHRRESQSSSSDAYPPPPASPVSPISPATTIRASTLFSASSPTTSPHPTTSSTTPAAAPAPTLHYSAAPSSTSTTTTTTAARSPHPVRPAYPSFPSSSSSFTSTHSNSSNDSSSSEGRHLSSIASSSTSSSSSDLSLHRRHSSQVAAIEPPVDLSSSTPFLQHAAASATAPSAGAGTAPRSLYPTPVSSSHRSHITLPIITAVGHRRHASKSHPPRPQLFHRRAYSPDTDSRRASDSSPSADSSRASPGESPSEGADSPVFSPGAQPTPVLLRHHSGASSAHSLATPSPMTPTYGFDPLDQNKQAAAMAGGLVDPYHGYPRHPGPYFTGPPPPGPLGHPLAGAPPPSFYPITGNQPPPHLGAPEDAFGMPPGPAPPAHMGVVPYAADLIEPSPHFAPPPPAAGVASVSPPNQHASPANASAGTAQQKARKKYPCPHAARYGCTDTFTTSGHAARHGKKHTGEKNILCPTCHKAFTRKDNMKQHERTHRNNRDSVNSAGSGHTDGTSNKRGKPNHASTSSIGHRSDAASTGSVPPPDMDLDPALNFDPQLRGTQPHGVMMPPAMDFNHLGTGNVFLDADLEGGGPSPAADETHFGHAKRPAGIERQVSHGSQDGEGESPGLDALAMAASGFT